MGKSVTSGDDDDVRVINSRPSSESSDSSEQSNGTCVVNLPKSTNLDGVVNINRPIVTLEEYHSLLGKKKLSIPLKDKLKAKAKEKLCTCTAVCWLSVVTSFFPITKWLPKYNVKNNLLSDLLTGLTVGLMSIPQGMAYARLAGMPPVYGLYTNLIPTMTYVIFGTSKHTAFGAATVMSLLMGEIRYKLIPCEDCWREGAHANASMNGTSVNASLSNLTPIEVGTSTAFLVGVILIIMGLIRLDFLTSYLSDQIVSGYTSGAAVHIFSAQLDAFFGVHIDKAEGAGKIILTYVQLFKNIANTNVATLIISVVTLAVLIIIKLGINPRIQKWTKIPIPGELIVVIVGTVASYFLQVKTRYGVKIVDKITAEFPAPIVPRFDIMKLIFADCLVLAVLTYCQAISQALLYAKIHSYKINTQQEFFAVGLTNVAGSFFQSFNSGMSVSRSIVCERAGAKSQLAGLIGTSVVIITILFVAPYLAPLPNGVLAAIIITACIDLLRQLKELKHLWLISKYDFVIYLLSFAAVVFLDVTFGLLFSVLFAIITVVIRNQCQRVVAVGQVPGTEFFVELDKFPSVGEKHCGLKVVQFNSPLYYANVDKFKSTIFKIYGHGQNERKLTNKIAPVLDRSCLEKGVTPVQYLILNCANILYVDLMGAEALKDIYIDFKQSNVTVLFSNISDSVHKMLMRTKFYELVPKENIFVTVYDAMAFKNQESIASTKKW